VHPLTVIKPHLVNISTLDLPDLAPFDINDACVVGAQGQFSRRHGVYGPRNLIAISHRDDVRLGVGPNFCAAETDAERG
jgi:hypothetical protein